MNILLPVDGSPLSIEAVHQAIRLVREGLKASVVVANVQEPSSLYEMVVVHDTEALRRVALEAGEHAVARASALLDEAGIQHEVEIASGEPAHTLLDIVDRFGSELVVIGAHGAGEASTALGSVAQDVLRHSPVPVLVVRVQAPADAADTASTGNTDSL